MKKKRGIILVCIVTFVGILFLVQHFFLREYGCVNYFLPAEGCCHFCVCGNFTQERICSFKTFLIDKNVSEKLFLWFGVNTRSLKEKPKKITTNYNGFWWQQNIYLS